MAARRERATQTVLLPEVGWLTLRPALQFPYSMQSSKPIAIRGRGAAENPPNRFEKLAYLPDPDLIDPLDETERAIKTQYPQGFIQVDDRLQ